MVPLVLCFTTMWSVPDTVSWGADYERRTDSSVPGLLHNNADMDSISGSKVMFGYDIWLLSAFFKV